MYILLLIHDYGFLIIIILAMLVIISVMMLHREVATPVNFVSSI